MAKASECHRRWIGHSVCFQSEETKLSSDFSTPPKLVSPCKSVHHYPALIRAKEKREWQNLSSKLGRRCLFFFRWISTFPHILGDDFVYLRAERFFISEIMHKCTSITHMYTHIIQNLQING